MIIQIITYSAECDKCGEIYMHCDYDRQSEVVSDAQKHGWYFTDHTRGKCYCSDCHKINDNDELVLK